MDKYDEAVAYLTAHPDEIFGMWARPEHPSGYGCLFQAIDHGMGCLTQIRQNPEMWGHAAYELRNLVREIAADERIADNPDHIQVKDLPVFAAWQRRLDKELNRDDHE